MRSLLPSSLPTGRVGEGLLFTVISVMVAVLVPVFIAILVPVPAASALCSIENECHILVFLLLVDTLQFRQHAAFQQTRTYHKDSAVGILLDNLRVCHDVDWRAVDEHIVVAATHLCYQRLEPFRIQQFGGVGRNGAHRQNVQTGIVWIGGDEIFNLVHASRQVIAQSLFGRTDVCRSCAGRRLSPAHPCPSTPD